MDKSTIEVLGIDDFALRKRERYGTILIDIARHRIVEIIESRAQEEVKVHLLQYPNVKIVCRDGSPTYRAAIREALPDAIQVSDFFHLVKGLLDHGTDHLKSVLPVVISLGENPERDSVWKKPVHETKRDRKSREIEERKAERNCRIRELKQEGLSQAKIAKEMGISVGTVSAVINGRTTEVHKSKGNRKPGKIARFRERIFDLFEQNVSINAIFTTIQNEGYKGSLQAISNLINTEKKTRAKAGAKSRTVKRNQVLKKLFDPKSKSLSDDKFENVVQQYPVLGSLMELVENFRALFETKDPALLGPWLAQAEQLNVPSVTSFVNGVRMDIDAVKAAIMLGFTSGMVEGFVNKLKVIKRVMYGRSSFALLRGKTLHIEARKMERRQSEVV